MSHDSHMWMSHDSHMWMSHDSHMWMSHDSHMWMSHDSHMWMRHDSHMWMSHDSHIWMSHDSHMWMSHDSHIFEWVWFSHDALVIESRPTYESTRDWVTSHISVDTPDDKATPTVVSLDDSCPTYEWVTSHIWLSHVTHMNGSRLTYESTRPTTTQRPQWLSTTVTVSDCAPQWVWRELHVL